MLKVSREVDLALLLLTDLVKNKKSVGLKTWAEERGLPYRYLSKIAVRLKKKGILKSKEGREGGYRLGKRAKNIKVMEVVEILSGPVAAVKCLTGEDCVCEKFCSHKSLMSKLSKAVENQLSKVTIEDLC